MVSSRGSPWRASGKETGCFACPTRPGQHCRTAAVWAAHPLTPHFEWLGDGPEPRRLGTKRFQMHGAGQGRTSPLVSRPVPASTRERGYTTPTPRRARIRSALMRLTDTGALVTEQAPAFPRKAEPPSQGCTRHRTEVLSPARSVRGQTSHPPPVHEVTAGWGPEPGGMLGASSVSMEYEQIPPGPEACSRDARRLCRGYHRGSQ